VPRYQLRYNRMRAFAGTRTPSSRIPNARSHLVSFEGMSTAGGGRTRADQGLKLAPLPLGYRGLAPWTGIEPVARIQSAGTRPAEFHGMEPSTGLEPAISWLEARHVACYTSTALILRSEYGSRTRLS
jgi:hypothetical protein